MAHHRVVTRTPSDGVGFEHAQSARRYPSFYAISRRSLAVPLRCHSVVAAMLAFPRRAGRHSGLFRSSCDRRPGVTANLVYVCYAFLKLYNYICHLLFYLLRVILFVTLTSVWFFFFCVLRIEQFERSPS